MTHHCVLFCFFEKDWVSEWVSLLVGGEEGEREREKRVGGG